MTQSNAADPTRAEYDVAQVELLKNACRATLLFYEVGPWDQDKRDRWFKLTGNNNACTRSLCDFQRLVLGESA